MPLTAGDTLGAYEIVVPLGAGGMGEVYKARDTRLDRLVAIKILPHDKMGDENRKRRFVQEAKAASALNHPNIVTIYDIGSDKGVDYLVMELVEGKSLDQLIPRGGLRLSEILRIAAQIADAFAKAHAAGIVHRDLKPGNVMVTPEGIVKVLDFGLAKLMQAPETASDATRTIAAQTGDGAVVGTAAYMSPEQAEGKPVDSRSDIFSFGSLLYEMATGDRAFRGDTAMSTISAILRDDPKAASESRDDVPPQFARVISRCLRKDPARRFQHMADLKVELEELKEESDSGKFAAPSRVLDVKRPSRAAYWIGGALVAVIAAFAGARFLNEKPATETPLSPVPLTSYPGEQLWPTFSPDGSQVAFYWNGDKLDNFDLYVKMIGPGAPLRLTTDAAHDSFPAWSPDGRSIAFERHASRDELWIMIVPPLGGRERKVGRFPRTPQLGGGINGLCWTPDSKWLITAGSEEQNAPLRLYLLSVETGERKPLTAPPPNIVGDGAPALSPDGRHLVFRRETGLNVGSLMVLDLSGDFTPSGKVRQIAGEQLSPERPVWTADGRDIVFASGVRVGARLYRVSASGDAPATPLAWTGNGVDDPAISWSGHRLAYSNYVDNANIWRVPVNGKGHPEKVVTSSFREVHPHFSPDGKRLAFYSNRSGSIQVWTSNADGSAPQQLTEMSGPTTGAPRWSPDGKSICFDSNSGGRWEIYTIGADGGKPAPVTDDVFTNVACSFSHDGRWIYYGARRSGELEVWKTPAGGGAAVQVTHGGGGAPQESPDGKWLYFNRNDGFQGVWRMPVEGGAPTQVVKSVWRVNFVPVENGIYYTPPRGRAGESSVEYLDFKSCRSKKHSTWGWRFRRTGNTSCGRSSTPGQAI
jgi:eukaryotic-like serine/threonine-protein kinase